MSMSLTLSGLCALMEVGRAFKAHQPLVHFTV